MNYTNSSYSDAPTPEKFITGAYKGVRAGEYFFVDSLSTGLIPFLWTGVRVVIREYTSNPRKYDRQYILLSMSFNVGNSVDGVCGAPVVHGRSDGGNGSDGAVLGLFSSSVQEVGEVFSIRLMRSLLMVGSRYPIAELTSYSELAFNYSTGYIFTFALDPFALEQEHKYLYVILFTLATT